MDLPEARQRKNLLFDFYDALLTQRQREIFTMHYMDDCSLVEIGESMGITPQAVADMLKRTIKRLEHYDKLLGLVAKFEKRQATIGKIRLLLDELDSDI
ncbi:MAG: sigma-70 family RNA polymerase sigma factor [Defluviitaleaceae bacterium]|nr:sigma-70 family RNA polymerase sigma factor [Defluviitaleaceae bacterium]